MIRIANERAMQDVAFVITAAWALAITVLALWLNKERR